MNTKFYVVAVDPTEAIALAQSNGSRTLKQAEHLASTLTGNNVPVKIFEVTVSADEIKDQVTE
jgi:hypothetical protein